MRSLKEMYRETIASMARKKFPPLTQTIYSCGQLAKHFRIDDAIVREACVNGQIPWCEKRGHIWIIARRGAEFLEKWLARAAKQGVALYTMKATMRDDAAKCDPRVLDRQPPLVERDRLNAKQVKDIRRRVKRGESLDSVGGDYERDKSAISLISRGLRYAQV